jgi:ceramide glucosyltransferase
MVAISLFWLTAVAITALLAWYFVLRLGSPVVLAATPQVAVIVPVKGADVELGAFLTSLFDQQYPDYRVIFAVEALNDPAVAVIERLIQPKSERQPRQVEITVAGLAQNEGQKNSNLLAALKCLTPSDEFVVFADADMRPSKDWLSRLIAPLVVGEADIVSGFSWPFPKDRSPASLVVASMMSALVAVPRLPVLNAAWGGSTALSQSLVRKLDLSELWRNSFSDDLSLTAAAQQAGCRIAAPREMLQPIYFVSRGFGEAIDDAARWSLLFRIYLKGAYVMALAVLTFLAAGWIAVAAGSIAGNTGMISILIAAVALTALRTAARAVTILKMWGRDALRRSLAFLLFDPITSPVATILSAYSMWRAAFVNKATWAGITYAVHGPKNIVVVSR